MSTLASATAPTLSTIPRRSIPRAAKAVDKATSYCSSSPAPPSKKRTYSAIESSSIPVMRKQRRLSALRPTPIKAATTPALPLVRPLASPVTRKKSKTRLPLQSIHIRAIEHGLRVPVTNTPLGAIDDKAENILCTPPTTPTLTRSHSAPSASSMTVSLVTPRRMQPPHSAPASPVRISTNSNSLRRRNSIGCFKSTRTLKL